MGECVGGLVIGASVFEEMLEGFEEMVVFGGWEGFAESEEDAAHGLGGFYGGGY